MQGNQDWTLVEPNTGGSKLEPGCYICRILDVREGKQASSGAYCLEIIYDIAEGTEAGHYSDEWGRNNAWAHTDRWYYGTDKTNGSFRGRLDALEKSNPSFSVESFGNDENKLKGLLIGMGIQKRFYTADDGSDKEALEVARVWDTDYVRNGKAKLPDPRDDRDDKGGKPEVVDTEVNPEVYGDIPF